MLGTVCGFAYAALHAARTPGVPAYAALHAAQYAAPQSIGFSHYVCYASQAIEYANRLGAKDALAESTRKANFKAMCLHAKELVWI